VLPSSQRTSITQIILAGNEDNHRWRILLEESWSVGACVLHVPAGYSALEVPLSFEVPLCVPEFDVRITVEDNPSPW
jgi:hypothetical protein